MNTKEIKQLISQIAEQGHSVVYDDHGSGSGGPGLADPDTLRDMLEAGNFDAARMVDINEPRRAAAFDVVGQAGAIGTWVEVEFCGIDSNYGQVCWLWTD